MSDSNSISCLSRGLKLIFLLAVTAPTLTHSWSSPHRRHLHEAPSVESAFKNRDGRMSKAPALMLEQDFGHGFSSSHSMLLLNAINGGAAHGR